MMCSSLGTTSVSPNSDGTIPNTQEEGWGESGGGGLSTTAIVMDLKHKNKEALLLAVINTVDNEAV